jgi:hypothetical protein
VPVDAALKFFGGGMHMDMDLVVIASTIIVSLIGYPLAKAAARYIEARSRGPQVDTSEISARLRGIEQAVDAISVELERVTEHQRFMTKLLSDGALPNGSAPSPEKRGTDTALPHTHE